jgi:TonB C terminal
MHALLLSLTLGGQGLGLPGFGLPWQERRIEAPELRVVLVPARVTAAEPAALPAIAPSPRGSIEQPVADGSALRLSVRAAPTPARAAEVTVPKDGPAARAKPTPMAKPLPDTATRAAPAKVPLRAESSGGAAPTAIPEPAIIAMERPDEGRLVVPAAPSASAPVIAAVPGASSPQAVMPAPRDAGDAAQERIDAQARERAAEAAKLDRSEQEAQRQAVQLEAARIEAARREAERDEAARQAAARQASARQELARQEAERVEAAQQAERQEAARQAATREEAERQETVRQATARQEAARQEAERQETQRVETGRLEAQRQEAARQAAIRQEAERQEAARQATARQEAARQEAARQEDALREARQVETARLEAERQAAERQAAARREEATRQEAARLEAQRVEIARQEAERRDAARQAATRQEAARSEAAQEEDARREARRRAIGRQLDEEAAKREAASTAAGQPSRLAPSSSGARRGRLFGRTDANAELVLYAEAWARKIELNLTFDMVREAAKRPHTHPLVTVAIRSDGSVESVTFVTSSGVAEIDDAIRRIVQSQLPYPAFPPGLAREFDVIEIRRTWYFDTAIRLY